MDQVPPFRLKQISFYLLLVALGILIFKQLSSFIPALLGAITFYVIMRSSMTNMVYNRKMKKGLSATILIVVSILVVLVWVLTSLVGRRISDAIKHSNEVLSSIRQFSDVLKQKYGFELLSDDNINKASGMVASLLPNVLDATFNTLTSVLMLYFILYFMLMQSKVVAHFENSFVWKTRISMYCNG